MSSCEVWTPESDQSDDEDTSSSEPEFWIDLYASIAPGEPLQFYTFTADYHYLSSWSFLSSILSHIGVPLQVQPSMIEKICTHGRQMADDPDRMHLKKTIPMVVHLQVGQEQEPAIPDFSSDHVIRFVPTRESAIQEMLRRVKIEGCEEQCTVCLDKFQRGGEATCMPCMHVYHENCIASWLEESNRCPVCRYEMPAAVYA